MSSNALIVIDMLNDFLDPKGALYCGAVARNIIPFVKVRVEFYCDNHWLVIYLQDSHAKDDREFEKFPKHAVIGQRGHEIITELNPAESDIVIQKRRYDGFFETNLAAVLLEHSIEEVEVVGVCTSICVMDTVGQLANRDYRIVVPKDGISDFDPEFHEFSLKRMERIYGAQIV